MSNTICRYPFDSIAVKSYVNNGELKDFWPCCMMGNATVEESKTSTETPLRMAKKGEDVSKLTPEELFNHPSMEQLRNDMLEGKRPKACNICWEQEDRGIRSFRQISLNDNMPQILQEKKLRTIDMSLNNTCNLRCRMCTPSASNLLTIDHNYFESNKLLGRLNKSAERWAPAGVGAFKLKTNSNWQWIISNTDKFNILRLSGGEPFYNEDVLAFIDECIEKDTAKNIKLEFHTNATLFNDNALVEKLNRFETELIFSIEATGKVYEYIRYPAVWPEVDSSVRNFASKVNTPSLNFNHIIMITNLFNLPDYIYWADSLRKDYNTRVCISFTEVHGQSRGVSTIHLPVHLLEQAHAEVQEAIKNCPEIIADNALRIIENSIKNNVGDKHKAKEELVLFDMSRNQHYKDWLDPRISDWLDV